MMGMACKNGSLLGAQALSQTLPQAGFSRGIGSGIWELRSGVWEMPGSVPVNGIGGKNRPVLGAQALSQTPPPSRVWPGYRIWDLGAQIWGLGAGARGK